MRRLFTLLTNLLRSGQPYLRPLGTLAVVGLSCIVLGLSGVIFLSSMQ
ncbi:MAG: hypothetical protein K0V04_11390 [Deltaproteobacteria bacterium]|nr:hypothetical protein [Deltaproteobacteria bacterium]